MIGIIGALDIEVKDIISEMDNPTTKTFGQLHFTSGRIGKTDCVVAKCGIGKVNAAVCTQTMILNYSPDMIINTGIAGQVSLTVIRQINIPFSLMYLKPHLS